jgi:hypothetical protein
MSLAVEMTHAAEEWLASLSAAQRERAWYPWPDEERTRWFYTPTDHGGLPLTGQRPRQQGFAMRLLATGLSAEGYATVTTVMGLENILDRQESWTRDWGRERGRDPGMYYLSVFGSPGDEGWGWRCGGHHVSLNYTIAGGRVVSGTPSFIGANPARTSLLADGSLTPLGDIEPIARDLARAIRERGVAEVMLHPSAISDIVSGNRPRVRDGDEMVHMQDLWRTKFTDARLAALVDELDAAAEARTGYGPDDHRALAITAGPKGVSGAALTPDERVLLHRLVEGYLGRFPAEIADRYRADGLDGLYFGYAGQFTGPVYYRLQGHRLLIEYDNTQSNANHAHSVVRDLEADFGGAL